MRGRAILGLALICALAASAVVASGASAAGTTAYTCAEGKGGNGFKDAHCTQAVEAGTGSFGHVAIAASEKTEISASNEKTSAGTTGSLSSILAGPIFGVQIEIRCESVTSKGVLTNEEVEGVMKVAGEMDIEHSNCVIPNEVCGVSSSIVYKTKFKTVNMGLEFTPKEGKKFGSFTLSSCSIAGTYNIEGSFEGVPQGATLQLNAEAGNLKWGGSAYSLAASLTLRKSGGEPIAFTT